MTLHTTLGDLKIELYCDEVPRTSENFLALAASGRYDNTKFHRCAHSALPTGYALRTARLTPDVTPADRNIKGFMIQVRWRASASASWAPADLPFTWQGGDPTGTGKVFPLSCADAQPCADPHTGRHQRVGPQVCR